MMLEKKHIMQLEINRYTEMINKIPEMEIKPQGSDIQSLIMRN